MKTSQRLSKVNPSMTLQVIEKAADLKRRGVALVDMGAGEPDFPTPQFIIDAAISAMREGYTRYTKNTGLDELKEAICVKLERDNGLKFNPENIMVTAGAKQSLFNFFMALLNEGDEVIVLAPYYVSFPDIIRMAGGVPVIVNRDFSTGFQPDPHAIASAVSGRTKAIIVNYPCNPTGIIYSKEALDAINRIAVQNDLYVVSDECYEGLVFDGPFSSFARISQNPGKVITIQSMSKTYAMTGWRIGYTAADPSIIAAMGKVQAQSTSCPNAIAQKASVAALLSDQSSVKSMIDEYRIRRDYVIDKSSEIPHFGTVKPQGAFFTFHDISSYIGREIDGSTVSGSIDLADYLISEARVVGVPGIAFGMDSYFRLSFATSMESIQQGLVRINEALQKIS